MRKTITLKWLKSKHACLDGIEWFKGQKDKTTEGIIKALKKEKLYNYLNWLLTQLMNYKQRVKYAVYAATKALPIFEKEYPDNRIPRDAINAAKKCIKNPSETNKYAAHHAYYAARTAAYNAANVAAYAAAYAAASYAGSAADASAAAANAVASSAANAAGSARKKMLIKITNYGIKLLGG